jgi:outer membrane receptor protein involved in Fe transport
MAKLYSLALFFIIVLPTLHSQSETDTMKTMPVDTLSLENFDTTLNEVQVTATRSTYVNDLDRKIYYPELDIQAQSGSVTDILQNIPSVTVDPEGAIQLRGSANVQFLINGQPSILLNTNSAIVLEQIPAHTIERIEIITNPSAKYKPDGEAGIINIITKKNVMTGFNGSVLLNASTSQRYNGSCSLNYNPGKINISGLYSYWQNYSPRTLTDMRIIRDSTSLEETYFDLVNNSLGQPHSHTASLNFDYQPNEVNSFALSGTYFNLQSKRHADITTLETNAMGIINDYSTDRTEEDNESELELNANVKHTFKKEDHAISLELQYNTADEIEDSRFTDTYRYPAYPEYQGYTNLDKKGNTSILAVDYTNPFHEDLEFETGYVGEFSSGELDYHSEYFDQQEGIWKEDVAQSNRFLFQQDIHAAYATLSKTMDNFGITGGLRAEQTYVESNLIEYDSVIPNQYFYLFPTLHLSYELNEREEMGLSYSRRVERPDPDELNPFPEYTDPRDIEAGNPYLEPEQIHSIELSYRYQNKHFSILPTFYFHQVYNEIAEASYYINDSTLLTTIYNQDEESTGGLELVLAWTASQLVTLNLSSNLFYQTIDASDFSYDETRSQFSLDTKLAAFFSLPTSTRFQFNATFRSSMLTEQGHSLPVFFLNAGVKQELFHKKAAVTLTLSDVFNTQRWRYVIDSPLLYQEVSRKRKSQIVYLGFSYRFGISTKKEEELMFDDKL